MGWKNIVQGLQIKHYIVVEIWLCVDGSLPTHSMNCLGWPRAICGQVISIEIPTQEPPAGWGGEVSWPALALL